MNDWDLETGKINNLGWNTLGTDSLGTSSSLPPHSSWGKCIQNSKQIPHAARYSQKKKKSYNKNQIKLLKLIFLVNKMFLIFLEDHFIF